MLRYYPKLFICLVLFHCFSAVALANGPRAVVTEKVWDFGSVEQGVRVAHKFKISNEGTGVLEIRKIAPACGCTAAVVDSNKIQPGSSTYIQTTFDTTGFRGPKEKRVSVYTNDPRNTNVVLALKADVATEVYANPARLYLADIPRGGSRSDTFIVASLASKNIKIKDVKSRSPHISVESEPYSEGGKVGSKIKVTVDGNAPLGSFRSRVTVRTTSKKDPVINIPVLADIYGEYQITPKSVSFGVLDAVALGNVVKQVSLINTSDEAVNILELKSADSQVEAKLETLEEGRRYRIKIGLKESANGIVQTRIVLKTDSKDPQQRELSLPVYAIVNLETADY
jgi:hypothetical protein